MTILVIISQR